MNSRQRFVRGVAAMSVVCILTSGCMVPVRSDPDYVSKEKRKQATKRASLSPIGSADNSSADRLTVNGDTVTARELWLDLRDELSTNAATLSPPALQTYLERRAAQLITDKIAEMLLYGQASLRLSESLTANIEKYVDAEIRKIVSTEHDGIQRRYERRLESQGQTIDSVRERLHREIIITSYLETEVRPKVAEPTRAELLATFETIADSLRRPTRRRMSLIDVRVRATQSTAEPTHVQLETARHQARSRVQAAQTELSSGVDFADVARRHSDGLHAVEGGSWGWVAKGSVRERFEPAVEVLYGLNTGEVSNLIEVKDGFLLVRCDEIDPGAEPDFETLQPQLKERLFIVAYNQLITERVAQLRAKAHVEPADLERFYTAVVEAARTLAANQ